MVGGRASVYTPSYQWVALALRQSRLPAPFTVQSSPSIICYFGVSGVVSAFLGSSVNSEVCVYVCVCLSACARGNHRLTSGSSSTVLHLIF